MKVSAQSLATFCRSVLTRAGADAPTSEAATRAMMHASGCGIDSHGVRLLGHYVRAIEGGRVNPAPHLRITRSFGSVALLDADDGHGAVATYFAMERAVELARLFGMGAVGIANSSHFGPAGAYALAAAEQGLIGMAFCNSDSFVRLHGGSSRFHGTNPIACAVPVADGAPWLLDMATSAIPYNRVQLYRSLDVPLPPHVASTADGVDTADADEADMLAPLGAGFGFKGAGLAGLVEILSAVMTGMTLSFDIAPMGGPDFSAPRKMGALVIAMRSDAFVDGETFDRAMRRYLHRLRSSPSSAATPVLAPGDREWAERAERARQGIPIDPDTARIFAECAARYDLVAALPADLTRAPAAPPG